MFKQILPANYKKNTTMVTSFIITAVRFVLESSSSTSVFPLTVMRPRPVRYASKILDKTNNYYDDLFFYKSNYYDDLKKPKNNIYKGIFLRLVSAAYAL